MSDKLIDISENVGLWVNANGKYGISSGKREMIISPAEFNALALHSPLVRDILALAKDWKREDSICPWCGQDIANTGHARNCPRENILEDVQALGCYDLEGDPILYKTEGREEVKE